MNRQVDRTRTSIGEAFRKLVFLKNYDAIRMREVAHAANVGRSTLYAHFKDKDAILVENLGPLLRTLSRSVLGVVVVPEVTGVLEHIWSHRDRGRVVLVGVSGARLEAALTGFVQEALQQSADPPARETVLISRQVSSSLFAALRTWLRGEYSASVGDLAAHLCASSAALCHATRQ